MSSSDRPGWQAKEPKYSSTMMVTGNCVIDGVDVK